VARVKHYCLVTKALITIKASRFCNRKDGRAAEVIFPSICIAAIAAARSKRQRTIIQASSTNWICMTQARDIRRDCTTGNVLVQKETHDRPRANSYVIVTTWSLSMHREIPPSFPPTLHHSPTQCGHLRYAHISRRHQYAL